MKAKKEKTLKGKETGHIYYYSDNGMLLAEYCPAFTDSRGREYKPTVYFNTDKVLTLDFNRSYVDRLIPQHKKDCLNIIALHSDAILSEMSCF